MTKLRTQADLENHIAAPRRVRVLARRDLVAGLGYGILTLKIFSLRARAGEALPSGASAPADSLIIHATPGLLSHVHDVTIPYAVLRAPPEEGVVLSSTKALFHTHEIPLSQKELVAVSQGEAIAIKRSSHRFVIALANSTL